MKIWHLECRSENVEKGRSKEIKKNAGVVEWMDQRKSIQVSFPADSGEEIAIAKALVLKPSTLLLDRTIFSALDAKYADKCVKRGKKDTRKADY